jgi:hypothetical protein
MDVRDADDLLTCRCDDRHCNENFCKTDGVCFASIVLSLKDSKISHSYR